MKKIRKKIALIRKEGLYLKDTGYKGRGVFCVKDIRAGEVLEVTPGLILNESGTRHADKTLLENYTFVTGRVSKRLMKKLKVRKTANCCTFIMGIASFCNHAEEPNAEITWEEREDTLFYTLKATRRIPKNTEVCTSYGAGWFDERE